MSIPSTSRRNIRPRRRINGVNYGYTYYNDSWVLVPAGVYPTGSSFLDTLLFFSLLDSLTDDDVSARYDEFEQSSDVGSGFVQSDETGFEEGGPVEGVDDVDSISDDSNVDSEQDSFDDSSQSESDSSSGFDSGDSSPSYDSGSSSDFGGGSDFSSSGSDFGGGGGSDFGGGGDF